MDKLNRDCQAMVSDVVLRAAEAAMEDIEQLVRELKGSPELVDVVRKMARSAQGTQQLAVLLFLGAVDQGVGYSVNFVEARHSEIPPDAVVVFEDVRECGVDETPEGRERLAAAVVGGLAKWAWARLAPACTTQGALS